MTRSKPSDPEAKSACVLSGEFYARPAEVVARALIGRALVRAHADGRLSRHVICETEAYVGPHDLACHAARGRTRRTEVMFGPPGTIYMYLIYGLYWMLNIVTDAPGYPAAVLVRGLSSVEGPGRLTRALALDGSFNGLPLLPATGLWIEETGYVAKRGAIRRTKRIGVEYAGPVWAEKELRFVLVRPGLNAG